MKIVSGSLDKYIRKIREGDPFTLARYGDGEWSSILGHRGKNCDGVVYSDRLCAALQKTLFDKKDYDYGMLAIAMRLFRNSIQTFHAKNNLDMTWVEATFLVAANRHGRLAPLIDGLKTRRLLYVGPKHLREIGNILPVDTFIEVHPTGSFENWENTVREVLYNKNRGDFVGISSGPAAKVMIHALFDHIGDTHSIMDFGSIWDGYVGVPSRKYMRRNTWKDFLKRNLQIA